MFLKEYIHHGAVPVKPQYFEVGLYCTKIKYLLHQDKFIVSVINKSLNKYWILESQITMQP